jgi:hypothetical protein
MPGQNRTKKAKVTGKQIKTQKQRGKQLKKKDARALKSSDAVLKKYHNALTDKEETDMTLAHVVEVLGGGRFRVHNLVTKAKDIAKIAKPLSTKKAKFRNATLPTAVHAGSYVILDVANTIKSVVGEEDAATLRELLHVPAVAEEEHEGYVFNRGVRSSKKGSRSSKKGSSKKSKGSSKGSKSSVVNMNMLGGWKFW